MGIVAPPREVTAVVTMTALNRGTLAVSWMFLALAVVTVADLAAAGVLARPALPLAAAAVMAGTLLARWRWTGPLGALLGILVGAVSSFAFQYSLLLDEPSLGAQGYYLLNLFPVMLVLVWPLASRPFVAALLGIAGYLMGLASAIGAQVVMGMSPSPGVGALMVLIVLLTILVVVELTRRRQFAKVPDVAEIEAETARMSTHRKLEAQAAAIIHDTVLNDLAAVANGPGHLDERTRERFLRDLEELARAGDPVSSREPDGKESDPQLADAIAGMVEDFHGRGLTVDVSGGDFPSAGIAPDAREAVVWALRSCLENVLRHAGTPTAEVFFDTDDDYLSVMVVDQGQGFEPDDVPADRLGIRSSLTQRITSCGGTVRLWSRPGAGTSVFFTVPRQRVGAPNSA